MGAEPWNCFTKYDSNAQRALDKLREEEFAAGRFRYAEHAPSSIEEALEIADADGTASILDIMQITDTPDFCCAAPFTDDELQNYFGTNRPTRADVQSAEEYWDDIERGHARYAVVYSDGKPSELYFAGYSFD
jgi:hypothetical protein